MSIITKNDNEENISSAIHRITLQNELPEIKPKKNTHIKLYFIEILRQQRLMIKGGFLKGSEAK